MEAENQQFSFPGKVPYYAQIASPELAEAIFVKKMDPRLDPRWREWGFEKPEEYAYWVERACGIICVKMVSEALGGECHSVSYWVQQGLQAGGYLVEEDSNGEMVEKGWLHRVLADLIQREGFKAQACKASLWELAHYLKEGNLVIASVSYQIGTDEPITRNSGHLVVVSGVETRNFCLESFIVHNPSGRYSALQKDAVIPALRFSQAYSGRVIVAKWA